MMKAIVSLSGGMDSATVLAVALEAEREVAAVGFSYGSKHNQYENQAAKKIADYYRVSFRLLDFSSIAEQFLSDLLKSGGSVPEGLYENESMKRTVVPGRNIIFCSILAGLAWSEGVEEVWLGIHSGDHAIYSDCRPAFYDAMRLAILEGTDRNVWLRAPFVNVDKGEILRRGLGVPYELTRTCYKDQPVACGKCGACMERLEAFKMNGMVDPVEYE